MNGSQIKTQLSQIIDGIVEDLGSLASEDEQMQQDIQESSIRDDAIEQLKTMIEFYRKDL